MFVCVCVCVCVFVSVFVCGGGFVCDQAMAWSKLQWFRWLQSRGPDLGVSHLGVRDRRQENENETIGSTVGFNRWLPPGFRSVKDYRSVCAHWWSGQRCVGRFMLNGKFYIARVVGGQTV